MKSLFWIRTEVLAIGIQERLKNGAVEAYIGGLEVQRSPGGSVLCRPVVADSYHFDEEQDLDLY